MKRDNTLDLALRDVGSIRDHARAMRERRDLAGIGDGCAAGCDFMLPERYDIEYLDLYFDTDAQAALNVAGNAAFQITMAPVEPWFVPVAWSVVVNDATDMGLDRHAFITALQVDGCRQLAVNTPAPTMATTQLLSTHNLDPRARNGCACPLNMAPYSNAGIGSSLAVISGINRNPVGVNIMVTVKIYGKQYGCCPAWLADKKDKGINPGPPPYRGNGSGTSTGSTRQPLFR